MDVRTQAFAAITGETYNTIRNIYGRPGRAPREPGPAGETDFRSHRRFIFADAVAWRITRNLAALGLEWDAAASLIYRERPTYWAFDANPAKAKVTDLLAVWPIKNAAEKIEWAAWVGSLEEITEVVCADQQKGTIAAIRMVSIGVAIAEAEQLAKAAGFAVVRGEFVAIPDDESDGEK